MKGRRWVVAMTTAAIATASVLHAQRATGASPEVTARLTMVAGDIWVMRDGDQDWVQAVLNSRLYAGDAVSAGELARAELAIGFGVFLRLDARSEARIAELTSNATRIQLYRGLAQLIRWKGTSLQTEIETPAVVFRPLDEGVYRFQSGSDGEWTLTVRKGRAEAISSQDRVMVQKKELIRVRGIEEPEYIIVKAPGDDEWDRWNSGRDYDLAHASSNWCLTLSGGWIWGRYSGDPK